jgi:hypothetical protein
MMISLLHEPTLPRQVMKTDIVRILREVVG